MSASQSGVFSIQEFTDLGVLGVGMRLYTYVTGTTTFKAAYTDAAGLVPHTYTLDSLDGQYIALNARGELPAPLFLTTGAYDIALKRADGSTVWTRFARGTDDALGGLVTASATLNVPSQFSTIQAAITYLSSKRLINGAVVTIQVADGTYTLAAGISLNHPDGANIHLLGNTTTPANCVLTVSGVPTFDMLSVTNSNTLGLVDGFKFDLAAKATSSSNFTAILAANSSKIFTGPNILTNNWYYGIAARNKSFIYCRLVTVTNAGDVGIWSYLGSDIDCQGATSTGASDATNGLGFGFQAERESTMDASNAIASGCLVGGIASLSNSHAYAPSAVSNNNTGSGFFVRDGATIENHGATASTNTRYGEEWLADGRCYHNTFTTVGNTIAANNGQIYLDNGSLGARLAANGDLRIDNNGTGGTYFNTSGGLQFGVTHTGGATSWLLATGGVGGGTLSVGGAANSSINLRGSGSGSVFLGNSAANYVRVNNASTTTPPQVRAEGSDIDVDLLLGGKNAGVVRFGTLTASGDAAMSGYITIKDAAGTTRKLMVTT